MVTTSSHVIIPAPVLANSAGDFILHLGGRLVLDERERSTPPRRGSPRRPLPPGTPVRLGKQTSNLFRFDATRAERLDTAGLAGVIRVDPDARTAEVQGMSTYEDFVDVTLAHGLMPLVVPQLKTITLGGAVAGLGIESRSFRHGLHESVREVDILTGSGDVVTAKPDDEATADLFQGFPNSYGTLGYALRLVIDLQPVAPYVRLEHRRFADAATCGGH